MTKLAKRNLHARTAGHGDSTFDRGTAILSVASLQVRYRNGALGVSNVAFSIAPGEVCAVVGPNGAGKTTTVRAVSGFLRTEGSRVTGNVTFAGSSIVGLEPHRIARMGVATVPERNKVFTNLTVREHLAAAVSGRARQRAAFDRVYEMFPVLASRERRPAGELSGGQQQMLAMGRALVRDPSLLIVDEMMLGLHPSLEPVLTSALRAIARQGVACLVADESVLRARAVSDRLYYITDGKTTEPDGESGAPTTDDPPVVH